MRNKLVLAGLIAAVLPGVAMAQPADPSCVRSNHDSRVEGTVLGAVGGAVVGGLLGHGVGAAVGGVGGAVAGNAIAGSRNTPCPSGYYYAQPQGYNGAPPPPPQGYEQRPDGAGYDRRADDRRPDDRGPGYDRRPDDRGPGYDRRPGDDHDRGPGYAPAYAGPPEAGRFWNGAPGDLRQRLDFMQERLQEAGNDGRLNHAQLRRAYTELRNIRGSVQSLWRRDNGLTPDDQAYVQARLDHLGASVHWMERTGY